MKLFVHLRGRFSGGATPRLTSEVPVRSADSPSLFSVESRQIRPDFGVGRGQMEISAAQLRQVGVMITACSREAQLQII